MERRQVLVSGLPDGTTETQLEIHFQSEKVSGGGDIEAIKLTERGKAIITFEEEDDAQRTVKHSPYCLGGSTLGVSLLDQAEKEEKIGEEEEEFSDEANLVIIVSELLPRTTKDAVRNYFENSRRSGGGEISSIDYCEGSAVATITFTEVKDRQRLLEGSHKIDGKYLTVVKQPPKKKVPLDPYKVFVQGLNERTSEDCLRFYLEKFSDVEVIDVVRGCDGKALVHFDAEVDFSHLFDRVSEDARGVEGVKPHLERVPLCSSILVTGLDKRTSDETLELYFESSKRSGGTDVIGLERKAEHQTIVHFKDPWSVCEVIQRDHNLEGKKLSVAPYYAFLEENASDKPRNSAAKDEVDIEFDPDVMAYIQLSHNGELQTLMGECNVCLAFASDDSSVKICPSDKEGVDQPWNERVETIERFLRSFKNYKIDLRPDLFVEVQKRWQAQVSQSQVATAAISFDKTKQLVQIIGKRENVERVVKELTKLINAVEEDVDLQKSILEMEEDGIPRTRLSLLKMSGFVQRLQDKCKHVKISVDLEKEKLHLQGPKTVLQDVVVETYKFTSKVVEKTVEFSVDIVDVLRRPVVSVFVEKLLKENGVQAIVVHDQSKVQVVGVNSESASNAETFLRSIVQERSVELTNNNIPVLESPRWKDFSKSLTSKFKVGIEVNTGSRNIWIRGICKDVERCNGKVRRYLESNTIIHDFVNIDQGCTRFLCEVWKEKLDAIKKDLSDYSVDMRFPEDRQGIEIRGNADGLKKCKQRVQDLATAVKKDRVPVDKPGMRKFFLEGKGSKILKSTESENHCIILTSESIAQEGELSASKRTFGDPGQSSGICLCSYVTPEGKKICVFKDDLTKHPVDAIVNAANEDLRHIGGLAAAILQAGGSEIQTACNDYIRENGGPLLEGDAMVTNAGKLPCEKVIHVVGPKWDSNASKERREGKETKQERYLGLAIRNSLIQARGFRSIAIPAVSSGVFGFPRDLCASVIVGSVLEFCQKNPACNLTEIHLTNKDDPTVSVFVEEIKRRFRDETTFVEGPLRLTRADKEESGITSQARINSGSAASGRRTGHSNSLTTPNGGSITVTKGDLAKEQADVLVGTVGGNLDLNRNPCAQALAREAGTVLQQECTRNGPVAIGNITVITQTGKLGCSSVIFAICSDWDGGKGKKVLQNLVRKCLNAAGKMKAATIAFPAIGTGTLQFPRDVVAEIYFDEVISYGQRNASTTLKSVKFVLYDQDVPTFQAFEAELAKRSGGSTSSRPRKGTSFFGKQPLSPTTYAFSPVKERTPDHFQTSVGSLCFQVQNEDITKEKTDALVIVSNPHLNMSIGGGAAAAILDSGGISIQQECSMYGQQPPGAVVVTSAGRLKSKFIFHVVPLQYGDIKETILKCLQEAENKGISSISFPAIGTGNLGMSPKSSAEAMMSAVYKFSLQEPASVALVRVVVFKQDMLPDFRSAMAEASGEKPAGQRSVWSRIKSFIGFSDDQDSTEPSPTVSDSYEKEVNLFIFAGCGQDLQKAAKAVKDVMAENSSKKVIENKAISDLTESHMRRIRTLELRYDVEISVEKAVARIVVRGQPDDVLNAVGDIHDILHKLKDEEHDRHQAEILAKSVQWSFKDDEVFEEFEPSLNAQIESAYDQKKTNTIITLDDERVELNFKTMTLTDLTTRDTTELRRVDHREGVKAPDNWAPQPKDPDGKEAAVHVLELTTVDNPKEFQDVSDKFHQICPNPIYKIERVQNLALYRTYAIRRKEMDERNGSNEMPLFHGTAGENCDKINHAGFNRSFCGKNATVFGNGVYFARDASYSARPQYSPVDANGLRYMYLARVLVGDYAVGNQGLILPPKRSQHDETDRYDSAVDQMVNPAIFVAFYDWQCYPEYLITFK